MKGFKWLVVLLSVLLCSVAFAQAPDYEKITDEFYKKVFTEKAAIDSWTEGVYQELGVKLSKIEVGFKQDDLAKVDGGTILKGTLRIKILGYKNDNRVHLIVERLIIVFIDETNTLTDARILAQEVSKILPGWNGIET